MSTQLPMQVSMTVESPEIVELGSMCRGPVDLEIIIPAYNEENRLARTLRETADLLAARPWHSRIVVVDNGSVDATPAISQRAAAIEWGAPVTLIGCAAPGKGAAIRRGMLTSSADYVGYMDADLATPIEALDGVMNCFAAGAEVVVGSRRAPGAEFAVTPSRARRLGSLLFSGIGRQLAPGISDTQCGFKFFRGDVGRQLLSASSMDGFALDLELLALAMRQGHDVRELPVRWTAQPGSTFRPIRDGLPSFVSALQLLADLGRTPVEGWRSG